jgi:hypothetical protein
MSFMRVSFDGPASLEHDACENVVLAVDAR